MAWLGITDDTVKLQSVIIAAASAGKIVCIDVGTYRITETLFIPKSSKIVGEGCPVIMSSGTFFASINSPQAVVQVGNPGDSDIVELSDFIISTQGSQPGAVLIKWNLSSPSGTPFGMWDVHARIGRFAGSSLSVSQYPTSTVYTALKCYGTCMSMHVTKSASGLYTENACFWVADHDVDDPNLTQFNVYIGRGLYMESTAGSFWLWGASSEHYQRFQYSIANTKNIFMGFIQTETPYYQPTPNARLPFPKNNTLNDNFDVSCPSDWPANCALAYGLRVLASSNILVYGAGLYSFFNTHSTSCSNVSATTKCQKSIFLYDAAKTTGLGVYNLNTVGSQSVVVRDTTSPKGYQDNVNSYPSTIVLFKNA